MPLRDTRPSFVVTGRVIKPYGVFGWVKVEVLTTNPQRYRKGNAFLLEGCEEGEKLLLEEVKEGAGMLLVKFQGLDDREQAERLKGRKLLVTPDDVGEPPLDHLWEHQLLGLEVITTQGRHLGEVVEIIETGANDVIVVKGDKECLIPMIEEAIVDVELEEGRLIVEPLPGLLET
jgi:16S rRNA processing protein RimM